uniref:Putative cytochrome P450 monooxygenase n=1 Tax=Coleophoma empetri TaxID=582885 RepID=U3THM1_9HELO|nr:McfF [Coleophoma empetri]BAN91490.1 putative cytochrome P450 monooxygenase [Coleophoma empetri]
MLSDTTARIERIISEQTLFSAVLSLFMIGLMAHLVLARFSIHNQFWSAQVWTGVRAEWFPKIRAKFRTIGGIRQMLSDGYKCFSKQERAFVLPMLGEKPWLVLPPSSIPELLAKSDSEVDMRIVHEQQLQHEYTQGALGRHVVDVPIQYDVIHRQLNRKLPHLIDPFNDEFDKSFRKYWGTDASYTDVKVSATCEKIIAQVANRIFAGPEICRNEDFLEHSRLYSAGVGRCAIILRMLPQVIRSLVAPLVTYPNRKHHDVCLRVCLPVVRDRLQRTSEKRGNLQSEWEPPVDMLQWIIEEAFNRNEPKELDAHLITQRILKLNFVSIETIHMSMTHAILDLYRSPHSERFVAGLRQECDRVLEANNGQWTKSGLDDLLCIDSTIRESMRYSNVGYIALTRMVVDPHGTQFHANGKGNSSPMSIPSGIRVCVPAHAIHRDPEFYSSPHEFQAFRFAEAYEKNRNIGNESYEAKISIVTTTDKFLPFGHGRHACPGRFFAAQMMKLMLVYLVQNYDVEKLSTGVENKVTVGTAKPDSNLSLRVRRRTE